MKNLVNEDYSDINNNDIFSILECLENHKGYNTFNTNKNINNNFNYNFNKELFNKKNKRKKRLKNENNQIISQTSYDIGNNLSNIKKQLNNISLNEKNTLKISKIKNYFSPINSSYFLSISENNKKGIKIINNKNEKEWNNIITKSSQISFSILKEYSEKNDIMIKNKELQNENDLLKENIKFLLSQIKKVKKIESANINKQTSKEIDKTKKVINKNEQSNNNKNNNKINNVFDIINKYKKEINTLKQKLKKLNKENIDLKEYISSNSKFGEEQYIYDDDNIKSMKIFQKNKPNPKNKILNKKISLKQRNIRGNNNIYRKKSFNKTFSSSKKDNYSTYNYDNSNINNLIKLYNTQHKNNNNKYNLNNNEKNKKNLFNTINKDRNIILIDKSFTGKEKFEIHTNAFTTKNKNNHGQSNNIFDDDKNKSYIFNNYDQIKSLSFYNNELYHRKQISSNKIKKISINSNFFNRKKLFNEINHKDSEKYIAFPKIEDDTIFKIKIDNL